MFDNTVTLTGHLGAQPETRTTAAGQSLATVRIAVSKSYRDNHGNFVKDTQWFRVTAWGRVGERMAARLTTGDRVRFQGRLSCRTYETKEGVRRESVEVVAADFEQLPRLSQRRALVEIVADAERGAAIDSTEPTTPADAEGIVKAAGGATAPQQEAKVTPLSLATIEDELPF